MHKLVDADEEPTWLLQFNVFWSKVVKTNDILYLKARQLKIVEEVSKNIKSGVKLFISF